MNRRTDPPDTDYRDERNHYCAQEDRIEKFDKQINGNGEPGLIQDVAMVRRALYGDPKNQVAGVVANQLEIMGFINSLKPFLNPKLLITLFTLSFFACIKVLGSDLIINIAKHFIN